MINGLEDENLGVFGALRESKKNLRGLGILLSCLHGHTGTQSGSF
jgi:hypothetical protein